MWKWLADLSPDFSTTLRRFPLAICMAALGTLIAIAFINDWIGEGTDFWPELAFGLFTGAIFATAGSLFAQSRPDAKISIVVLAYILPLVAVALLQVWSTRYVISPLLPVIGLFWLSVSPVTRWGSGEERADIQNRFWWINHRAITTAIVAGVAFGLISLGLVAIERAMAVLFGLKVGELFYQYLLPFTGLFLTPVYWLSTIPKLDEYTERDITEPDFLSQAIGFLGQFILAPFLFVYALILLAYAVQIVVTFSLPEGMLGWMVLGFTIVGAATWLVLHPKFMHERLIVKQFRRWWFWLTIIPLLLYVIGVSVRIDAYGLTELRMGLVAGGIWAGLLTLFFLTKRYADIRLIPGLAGAIILALSVGPWNFVNLPLLHQNMRLEAAIHNATQITQSTGGPYEWSEEGGKAAAGAIDYLSGYEDGRVLMADTLSRQGIILDDDQLQNPRVVQAELVLESGRGEDIPTRWVRMVRPAGQAVDVSRTPFSLGSLDLVQGVAGEAGVLEFVLAGQVLSVRDGAGNETVLDLLAWKDEQAGEVLAQPVLGFALGGASYVLIVEHGNFLLPEGETVQWEVTDMRASLFSDKRPEPATE
ncbi:MAG TPA: DUF4153 domain-containing protein [Devosia sp.]|nr:DUF4153 domain-containing protein [Devosia sp.]